MPEDAIRKMFRNIKRFSRKFLSKAKNAFIFIFIPPLSVRRCRADKILYIEPNDALDKNV